MNRGPSTAAPRTWFERLCLRLLSWLGWRSVYVPFPEPKGVILVYPHTSNWDFIIGALFRFAYRLEAHWIAKHSAFRWPLGPIFRSMGGIPVDRRKAHGTIGEMVKTFGDSERLWVAITPEGTRSHVDHWKSGFYRIALAADLPCGLGYIDFETKTICLDTYVRFTGDEAADLTMLREFYAGKRGLRPTQAGDIRFRRS